MSESQGSVTFLNLCLTKTMYNRRCLLVQSLSTATRATRTWQTPTVRCKSPCRFPTVASSFSYCPPRLLPGSPAGDAEAVAMCFF